ncbi:hypothetical protein F1D05_20660 [Kribbella qitaiheensis]|uniref:DUF3566 domain-containing protein n=1 Tax=Kribbella qitaiheensis TaxID=1544730 RepID=A0A7G6X0W5_9ACTN|nr:DUF3566 domain-containing protein [Kribbella qitaiheensis]QNE19880.1 hypothetical protein F1D05_20660 [Kribbella qitaiheensis]
MTNRARPTWPDGAADSSKSQTPPGRTGQGANGKGQPTPPATPTSNGRTPSGNGQRPGTPAQPQRPAQPLNQSGTAAKPVQRPPQQPPVRPPSGPSSAGTQAGTASPVAPVRPPLSPSTPGRPEPRPPLGEPVRSGRPATPAYGQTGKIATPSAPAETFGDKVNAAKQAVLDKAAAVKDAATQGADRIGSDNKTEAAAKTSSRPQTRKARLRLSRVDPWSVMKTAFLLSIAFGIVTWVAVFIVWSAIGAAGVFDNINNTVSEVLGTPSAEPFRIEDYVNTGKVMGFTTLLACADVLIITALATLGSFLYNIAATLLGGLEVTLASED